MKTALEHIQELDERDIAASLKQDRDTLLDLWDADGVALPPGQPPVRGLAALGAWLSDDGEAEYDVTEYDHNFLERVVIGDWAFEWGTYRSAAEPLGEGEPYQASGKLLRILRRQPDGEWKISHAIWNADPQPERR